MRSSRWLGAVVLGCCIVLVLADCFSFGGFGGGSELPPLLIRVNNNLSTPTHLSVYITSANGQRLLGDVEPSTTRDFPFSPTSYMTTYQLFVRATDGSRMRSQTFSVGSASVASITWTLVPNMLQFDEEDD